MFVDCFKEGGRGGETRKKKKFFPLIVTNPWNKGLISADRNARIALMLTIPRSLVKSSTKDLSLPIFEIVIQRTHCSLFATTVGAAIL